MYLSKDADGGDDVEFISRFRSAMQTMRKSALCQSLVCAGQQAFVLEEGEPRPRRSSRKPHMGLLLSGSSRQRDAFSPSFDKSARPTPLKMNLSFPRKRESRESPRLRTGSVWIPAFAGMTGRRTPMRRRRRSPIPPWIASFGLRSTTGRRKGRGALRLNPVILHHRRFISPNPFLLGQAGHARFSL